MYKNIQDVLRKRKCINNSNGQKLFIKRDIKRKKIENEDNSHFFVIVDQAHI